MGIGEDQPAGWDFFISYTQADRAWAEWIAWVLEEDGHKVLVQAWDFVPGGNWIQGMQAGAAQAARTIAVLSPAYLDSQYGTAEWQAAWASDPAGQQHKLLVTRVEESARPGLLSGIVSVDLHGTTEAEARARLRTMVSSAIRGRAKPNKAPVFPGGRAMAREPQFPGALPSVWKVPARNPHFTGRGEDLAAMARALASGSTVTVQSLRGMGGVGKTQLATEYCHAHAGEYDLVYWITAEESATIADQFTALAQLLSLDPVADPEILQAQVHDRLRGIPGWLLVFDNADAVEEIRAWLPGGPLLPGVPGHVIVTTRRGGFAALGQVMALDVVDLPTAVALLKNRVPALENGVAQDIAKELGRLPLALEQAAAYLDRSAMPQLDYLDLLRRRAADLYARGHVTGRRDTIATLWDITLERISTEDPAAVLLLELCAYLAPEPIPLDLFSLHADLLPESLSQSAADQLAFDEVIGTLVDYSLAKRTELGLQLHRLVQGVIRAQHAYISRTSSTRGGSTAEGSTARGSSDMLRVVLRLLSADAPEQIADSPQDWPRWAVLLAHVLAATSQFDSLPHEAQEAVGAHASWLLNHAAIYLQVHARPAEARPLAERALAITEAALGADHPTVASDLGSLAGILQDLGQPDQAQPLAERALAIDEAAHGPDHPTVATDLGSLAGILQDLGQPDQAQPLAERALAIDETAHGPDHPTVATDLGNLARSLSDLGQLAEAREITERALAIHEAALGPDHLAVATDLGNLTGILQDLGQPDQAQPLAERALAITEAAYGPDHPDIATRLNNLALLLRDLGQLDEARELAERALAIDEAAYGPDHPTVAIRLSNLALLLQDLGQPDQAQPLAERALAIHKAAYGPDHPAVATDLSNLALFLQDLGQPDQARPLAEQALAITEAAHGPDHPDIATRLNNLAQILQDLGQLAEARAFTERALAIDEAAYGPDHPDIAIRLGNLAQILQDLGQLAEARELAERALAIDEAAHDPDHPAVATDLGNLAAILQDLGQPDQARPLAEQALAITEAAHGPNHPAVATRLNNLAQILQDLGEPAEARPLADRALAITKAAFGPDHPAVAIRLSNLAFLLQDLGQPDQARPLAEQALAIIETAHGPDHPEAVTLKANFSLVGRQSASRE